MRCRHCNRILTYRECVEKDENSGEYLDTCVSCLDDEYSDMIDAEVDMDKELQQELLRPLREDEIELDDYLEQGSDEHDDLPHG